MADRSLLQLGHRGHRLAGDIEDDVTRLEAVRRRTFRIDVGDDDAVLAGASTLAAGASSSPRAGERGLAVRLLPFRELGLLLLAGKLRTSRP